MTTMTTTAEPSLDAVGDRPPVLRALVVDDEPSIRELLSMVLRYDGWDVRLAGDGTTALAGALAFGPDVVLLDVMLPDMNGFEVLRRLREADPGLPVVFLTARDAPEDRLAGLAAGADDYLVKPFLLEDLLTRLHGLVGGSRGAAPPVG